MTSRQQLFSPPAFNFNFIQVSRNWWIFNFLPEQSVCFPAAAKLLGASAITLIAIVAITIFTIIIIITITIVIIGAIGELFICPYPS